MGSIIVLIGSLYAVFSFDSQGLVAAAFSISVVFISQKVGNFVADCSNRP